MTSARPLANNGPKLISVDIGHQHLRFSVHPTFRVISGMLTPARTEYEMRISAARMIHQEGAKLVRDAIRAKAVNPTKGGFNISPGARLVGNTDLIATVEMFIPEGEPIEPGRAQFQIIPRGGTHRMTIPDWNMLIGQRMCDAAFEDLCEITLAATAPLAKD